MDHITYRDPPALTELDDGTPFPTTVSLTVIREGVVPLIDMTIEVREGRPVMTQFSFRSRGPAGPPLTATEIHDTNVGDLFEAAVHALASTPAPSDDPADLGDQAAGNRAVAMARRGRPVSDETLGRVAQIVKDHRDDDYRKQVATQEHVSLRTASRYIALAKERGLLTDDKRKG